MTDRTAAVLKYGAGGPAVRQLQQILERLGYLGGGAVNGKFDAATRRAVRVYQSRNVDPRGQPLVVDGIVGPLTMWSIEHHEQRPQSVPPRPVPAPVIGDADPTRLGGQSLIVAVEEMLAGACELGGNNRGRWVRKYLEPTGLPEGNPWCAAFVSWCTREAASRLGLQMPFQYTASSRNLLSQLRKKRLADPPSELASPTAGELVFWWRDQPTGYLGHVGWVHRVSDGVLYTVEGNKSPRVQSFDYVLSRVDRLLGYGRLG